MQKCGIVNDCYFRVKQFYMFCGDNMLAKKLNRMNFYWIIVIKPTLTWKNVVFIL